MNSDRPIIVMFVGIPGSGKTTFAKQFAERINAVVLNSDAERLDMWKSLENIQATHASPEERKRANELTFGAMNYAAKQILRAGYHVIYDCNANQRWERDERHVYAKEIGALSVVVRISVPYEVSFERVQSREDSHDQRQFTPEKAKTVLERFIGEIEEPGEGELVVQIDGAAPFEEQYQSFIDQFVTA